MKSIIHLENISVTFPLENGSRLTVLKDISLRIYEGEFFIFLGPSGAGKSTLLRVMSNLEHEFRGMMNYEAGVGTGDMSFVFQQFALLPWKTVADNVELGLLARHAPVALRKKKVAQELKRLGLTKFANAYPRALSGGMRQRVGIARALATDPKIVFLDEPFSEVDSFTAAELRKDLLAIWQEKKLTVVMVTHIIEEALELADRIAVLTPRPGKLEKILKNPLPRPREKRSAPFFALEDTLYKFIRP